MDGKLPSFFAKLSLALPRAVIRVPKGSTHRAQFNLNKDDYCA
jgi:hypothetical protein